MSERVSFAEALRVWARIGLLSFGGPAGQIALMHRELVERRRWIDEERFLHALNFCMLLPGPEAQQLATYIGWLLHKWRGALAAGVLFVLPGFAMVLAASALYAWGQSLAWVAALFFGLKCAVVALVFEAVHRIGRRAIPSAMFAVIAALSFVAVAVFRAPFPLVIVGAALLGTLGHRLSPRRFSRPDPAAVATDGPPSVIESMHREGSLEHTRPSLARTARVTLVCLALWWLPVLGLRAIVGPDSIFVHEALFFSQTAVVTFGGAYAVLAYVAQRAVQSFHWLAPQQMLDGLGLAESTPGPLILVLEFVGFVAAFQRHGLLGGLLGACVTVWVTFVPCFLWVLAGAPYIEQLRSNATLRAALSAITAAVVGVIANLSLWFALHLWFRTVDERAWGAVRVGVPKWVTIDGAAVALSIVAMATTFGARWSMARTLALCALLGLVWRGFVAV